MKYKTVFISDLHLGTKGCQHEELHDFLKNIETEKLYLVGDIIDGWRLKRKHYFPQSHLNIIRKFLSMSKKGTEVIYIPGNHDEFLRDFHVFDLTLGNLKVVSKAVFVRKTGEKYIVVHGDAFDVITRYYKYIAVLGDFLYNFLLWANTYFNKLRKSFGLRYWSLSKYLKSKTKEATNFISAFEEAAVRSSVNLGYDGIICGHIHSLSMEYRNGGLYMNTSDWVETCGGILEHHDGTLETFVYNSVDGIVVCDRLSPDSSKIETIFKP